MEVLFMAKNLVFQKSTSTKLKAVGRLDIEAGVIVVDDEEKSIATLFQDFDQCDVELTIQYKDVEEFDIP